MTEGSQVKKIISESLCENKSITVTEHSSFQLLHLSKEKCNCLLEQQMWIAMFDCILLLFHR